ncbi:hypothetical protein [Spiroplasma floricola]|uniref:Transmembrane protein n=1 Tax=Spiroplasma floricola 23-6 TaxID=1336749 RepID=A0A2K8SCT4_9MOLU|nr:hypothetical protein [Spiroplasma floricola]AUB31256.1 hypothetical protein SFLOR_v1c01950 [Spiroplasma floricola 23-6]
MKKMLSLLSSITIVSSGSSAFANATNQKIKTEKVINSEKNSVNWNNVRKETESVFKETKDSFKKNFEINNFINLKTSKNQQIDENLKNEMINYAQKEANKILASFQESNYQLDTIIDIIKNNYPDFKQEYDRNLNNIISDIKLENQTVHQFNNYQINNFSSQEYSLSSAQQNNKKLVSDLRVAKAALTTGCAAAAIAAAGFWAAAWWFGISTPWAIGCTVASTALGVASAGVEIALVKYDQSMNKWIKFGTILQATLKLGLSLAITSYVILVKMTAVVSTTTWCFPAAIAILVASGALAAWIKYTYK